MCSPALRTFTGTIARHNFKRGPKTHGSTNYRAPGSIGAGTTPGRVFKGLRMGGRMGVDRADLKRTMREQFDVGLSGEVYETPCHLQPIFAQFLDGPLPQAEKICAGHICLPVSAKMTLEDARYVLTSLGAALESLKATPVEVGG